MIFVVTFYIVFLLNLQDSLCQRKVVEGVYTSAEKRFAVYFVKSRYTEPQRYHWLCGGAIVAPTKILTAAGCLVEMKHIYAIAGYRKYVNEENIETDECTKTRKQKVVEVHIPVGYKLSKNWTSWSYMDIGVAQVEKPYDFDDFSYRYVCDYIPAPIKINYLQRYESDGVHGVVYGWGSEHQTPLREVDFELNYHFRAGSTILSSDYCKYVYENQSTIKLMRQTMLCGSLSGALNAYGLFKNVRRAGFINDGEQRNNKTTFQKTRRTYYPGPCTGDHGAPLTTWIGPSEYLIGVAVASSNENKEQECMGPFIYMSTARTGNVIKCLLEFDKEKRHECNNKLKEQSKRAAAIKIIWPGDKTEKPKTLREVSEISQNHTKAPSVKTTVDTPTESVPLTTLK